MYRLDVEVWSRNEQHDTMNTFEISPSAIVRSCSFGSLVVAYAKNKWGKERGTVIDAKQDAQKDGGEIYSHFYRNHRIEIEPSESHKAYFSITGEW